MYDPELDCVRGRERQVAKLDLPRLGSRQSAIFCLHPCVVHKDLTDHGAGDRRIRLIERDVRPVRADYLGRDRYLNIALRRFFDDLTRVRSFDLIARVRCESHCPHLDDVRPETLVDRDSSVRQRACRRATAMSVRRVDGFGADLVPQERATAQSGLLPFQRVVLPAVGVVWICRHHEVEFPGLAGRSGRSRHHRAGHGRDGRRHRWGGRRRGTLRAGSRFGRSG